MESEGFKIDIKNDYLDDIKVKMYDLKETLLSLRNGDDESAYVLLHNEFGVLKTTSIVYNLDFITVAANDVLHLLEIYDSKNPKKDAILDQIDEIMRFLSDAASFVSIDKWDVEKALSEMEKIRFSEASLKTYRKVLVIASDKIYSSMMRDVLNEKEIPVDFVKNEIDAFTLLSKQTYGVLVSSYYLTNITAKEMVQIARILNEDVRALLITSKESVSDDSLFSGLVQKDSSFRKEFSAWIDEHSRV